MHNVSMSLLDAPLRSPFGSVRGPRGQRITVRAKRRTLDALCMLDRADVVLTREQGKNGKLAKLLEKRQISWLEVPLIETAPGPDREALVQALQTDNFDWIAITSPEAATVFLDAWRRAGSPKVKITVVGDATGKVLAADGQHNLLKVEFTPSKANAKHLSAELPLEGEGPHSVLYPASVKAGKDLESGLASRGCNVRRLETYDTVPVGSIESHLLETALASRVLAIASPSTIQAWLTLVGYQNDNLAIACIGQTSAQAAEKLGYKRIFYPQSPGLEGFVSSIEDALESCKELSA